MFGGFFPMAQGESGSPGSVRSPELTSWVVLVPSLLICVHYGLVAVAWGLAGCAAVSVGILLVLLVGDRQSAPAAQPTYVRTVEN